MIITISELREIAGKAVSLRLQQWAEVVDDYEWEKLYDLVEANFSRFDWITQLAKETLMTADLDTLDIGNNMFFKLLERDFGWSWSCEELDFRTYWPVGFSYQTDRILQK